MATTMKLQVTGLGKQKMAALTTKAKRLGVTPERYVKQLVEDDLELDRRAQRTSLADLMGRGRKVDEVELDKVVEASRNRHHARASQKR